MSFLFTRDDRQRRIVIALQGAYRAHDIIQAMRRHEREDVRGYALLYDLRGLTGYPGIEEFRHLMLNEVSDAQSPQAPREPHGPVAVVASDPHLFGLACAYADLIRHPLRIEIFRARDEAERWMTAVTGSGPSPRERRDEAIQYVRDDARRWIRLSMCGDSSLEEVIGIIDRQEAEGTWGYGMLSDVRTMSWSPSRADIHRIVVHIDETAVRCGRPRGPVAIVTAEAAIFKRARLFAALGAPSGQSSEVFFDVPTAETWLDERLAS